MNAETADQSNLVETTDARPDPIPASDDKTLSIELVKSALGNLVNDDQQTKVLTSAIIPGRDDAAKGPVVTQAIALTLPVGNVVPFVKGLAEPLSGPLVGIPAKAAGLDLPDDTSPPSESASLGTGKGHSDLPAGYLEMSDGIYLGAVDDEADPVFLCSPIICKAVFSDFRSRGWGVLLSVRAPSGLWNDLPVLNAALQKSPGSVISDLVDRGLEIGCERKAKDFLIKLLKTWKPQVKLLTVNNMGWIDETHSAFALGRELIGRKDLLPMLPLSGVASALSVRGSIDEWKRDLGSQCRGNPLMILAVSLAFSAPLLSLLGMQGGGLHFRGASSSGKTTLLTLAASVWGERKLITQWRATANGIEAIAASMNDMLLPLDELAEISARDLNSAIYMLGNGTAKARMGKDATLGEQSRWRLAVISSGEISIQEKLREANISSMTGHEVRLIDVEADCRKHGAFDALHEAATAAKFANSISDASAKLHGAVGRKFVETVIQLLRRPNFSLVDYLNAKVDERTQRFLSLLPAPADGATQRVARRFAAIATAGEIATAANLTGWVPGEAVAAASTVFLDWQDRRFGQKLENVEGAIKQLKAFLSANEAHLQDTSADPIAKADAGVPGWKDASHFYLLHDTWVQMFSPEQQAQAAKALRDMEILIVGDNNRLTRKAPRSIPGRPRVYTLRRDRLDEIQLS